LGNMQYVLKENQEQVIGPLPKKPWGKKNNPRKGYKSKEKFGGRVQKLFRIPSKQKKKLEPPPKRGATWGRRKTFEKYPGKP